MKRSIVAVIGTYMYYIIIEKRRTHRQPQLFLVTAPLQGSIYYYHDYRENY